MNCLNYIVLLFIFYACNDVVNAINNAEIIDESPRFTTEIGKQNVTEIYQKYLSKINNYCLTKQEFEELFGNKSSYGVVYLIAPYLIYETSTQIGLNELRHFFNLQPQPFNFFDRDEEKPKMTNVSPIFYKVIKYFQQKVDRLHNHITEFRRDEIDAAEKFLDSKFPEIRSMFNLKYPNKIAENNHLNSFNETLIDSLFHTLMEVRSDIFDASLKMNSQSYKAFLLKKGPYNYCNM